ncbi:MAG: hypothetical protein HKN39_04960 [Flavobacteriales bacterium]|nr:hypothetical protein [Flavobacteriales bacterium]
MMDMSTNREFIFRPAQIVDIEQLTPMIIECLKGPKGKTNYEVIFGISHVQLSEMISNILAQEIPNHEFYYGNYMVCENQGEIISICCGWKEKAEMIGSENIRSSLLASYLGSEIWQRSYPMLKKFANINIPRQAGFLYLENANTKEGFKRQNIAYRLVYELIKKRKEEYPELETIHSHVYLSNKVMYNMFVRFQYQVEKSVILEDEDMKKIFPIKGLALVSIPISKYLSLFEENMSEH